MDWLKNLERESADPMSRKFWREDVQKIKDATKRGFQAYDDLYIKPLSEYTNANGPVGGGSNELVPELPA